MEDYCAHSDDCDRHRSEHLGDPEPGAADCICSANSGDPQDDGEVTRLREHLAGAVEAVESLSRALTDLRVDPSEATWERVRALRANALATVRGR